MQVFFDLVRFVSLLHASISGKNVQAFVAVSVLDLFFCPLFYFNYLYQHYLYEVTDLQSQTHTHNL